MNRDARPSCTRLRRRAAHHDGDGSTRAPARDALAHAVRVTRLRVCWLPGRSHGMLPGVRASPEARFPMPTKISRAEALRRIREEGGAPACLMCAIAARRVGDVHVIVEDEDTLVMLPRYVRRWGHVMALPKRHVTSYAEVDVELWTRTAQLAHQAARVVERVMRPRRCYLASTGSSAGELTQTSRHLHIHVVPIRGVHDLDFANADANPDPAALDDAAQRLRAALGGGG